MSSLSMPVQPAQKRIKNNLEVALGLSKRQAQDEAMRCPQPTSAEQAQRCPLGVDVFGFIRYIREGDMVAALSKIRENNPLPGICGRICSAPCQKTLTDDENWSVDIRALERFACDNGDKRSKAIPAVKRKDNVAIVGSGPAGLVCAYELARRGYNVTIFEAMEKSGGVLRYGIPEFRLPKKVLDNEIALIQSHGVEIKTNSFVGRSIDVKELFQMGFKAVYLATGSGKPQGLGITGEHLGGVYFMSEFLMRASILGLRLNERSDILPSGKKVIVLGSGGIAVDCARLARRLGKEVSLIFDRTEEELTPQKQEFDFAKEEGVHFEFLAKPLEILSDSAHHVRGVYCQRMDFAEVDVSGKWQLKEVEGSEFTHDCDSLIISGAHKPNTLLTQWTEGLKVNDQGTFIEEKDSFKTSLKGVFAGGDCAVGAGPLIKAMVSAKKAAKEIDQYLMSKP